MGCVACGKAGLLRCRCYVGMPEDTVAPILYSSEQELAEKSSHSDSGHLKIFDSYSIKTCYFT